MRSTAFAGGWGCHAARINACRVLETRRRTKMGNNLKQIGFTFFLLKSSRSLPMRA